MGKIKSKGVEKRKFLRLEIPLNVCVRIFTDEKARASVRPLNLKSSNISLQGICLETSQMVVDMVNMLSGSPGARESILDMEIELISGEAPLKARGEVCWYDVVRDTEEFMYQVGIVFAEFEGHGKEQLTLFIKNHRKNKGFFSRILSKIQSGTPSLP